MEGSVTKMQTSYHGYVGTYDTYGMKDDLYQQDFVLPPFLSYIYIYIYIILRVPLTTPELHSFPYLSSPCYHPVVSTLDLHIFYLTQLPITLHWVKHIGQLLLLCMKAIDTLSWKFEPSLL